MTTTMTEPDTRFVAYEYTTINASADEESMLRDAYHNFGWTCEAVDRPTFPIGYVTLRLKRDRAVPNRPALANLQRQLENGLESIANLERSKSIKASIVAYTVGIVGSAALAGSVFCFIGGVWVPFVALGVVGLVGWVLPYFLFSNIKAARTAAANQEIDRQFDQLYAICEQAASIVHA